MQNEQQSSGNMNMSSEKQQHSGEPSLLSGRCLNKGAQRAASVGPSASTGPEHSSWSICDTKQPLINLIHLIFK